MSGSFLVDFWKRRYSAPCVKYQRVPPDLDTQGRPGLGLVWGRRLPARAKMMIEVTCSMMMSRIGGNTTTSHEIRSARDEGAGPEGLENHDGVRVDRKHSRHPIHYFQWTTQVKYDKCNQ